jgi:signal transduction histidine kinase
MDSKSVKKKQPIDSHQDRRRSNEARLQELTNVLTEREKELNCVYTTSRLFENESLSIDDILQGVIDTVPPAWQYPEITCARLKIKNKHFVTERFEETVWKQAQNIVVNGKRFGSIEVYYTAEKPILSEGPFLKEERNLLNVIAERLGHTIERKMAERSIKLLYQQERKLREKLQAEMRVRVDFTRKLIHELKTPLTALIATSQLLYDETQGERIGKLAKYILDSASNLNIRVDELHDVVRGETGILKLTLKPVKIKQLLQSLINETLAMAQQSGISIELNIEREIPEIHADPDRLRQVVLNLVNNSIKYAREGHRIIIGATQLTGELQVEVRDFGPGIDEQRQKTIFEPGYQQSHLEERSGGLCIGLALCKTLIELHGGRIWVKSKVGKGARFFFSLPLKEVKKNDRAGH